MGFLITIGIILVLAIVAAVNTAIVVPQESQYVLEFLGTYMTTWSAGLHFKVPFLSRIVKKVSLKEQVLDFPPQSVITKDNVSMQIDTVVYLRITSAKLFTYGVESPLMAIENLTATTLRNIIGEMDLDGTLTSRDTINGKMQGIIDEATDPWGIKVNRVEVKNIIPPQSIQAAMEKEMRAERERRETILRAEGEKNAAITSAEGTKQAAILTAEAEKQSALLRAEAYQQEAILRAQGEADAIRLVTEAKQEQYAKLQETLSRDGFLQMQAMEALKAMADGRASTIFIPSELQGLGGVLGTIKGVTDAKAAKPDGGQIPGQMRIEDLPRGR